LLLSHGFTLRKSKCRVCGKEDSLISHPLDICLDCIRDNPKASIPLALETHAKVRSKYGLPPTPPKTPKGIKCMLCSNECQLGEFEVGYCGLKKNVDGKLISLSTPTSAAMYAYKDPQITNCCAAWFCPATGAGYPKYSYTPGPEYGYYNYAVFFYGCNFSCLFCQNFSHKNVERAPIYSVSHALYEVLKDPSISCVCFFGGSPEPSLPFALNLSRQLIEKSNRILRICFEWNGCGNPKLVEQAAYYALVSGGNIKFDLKAFSEALSIALSGVSNKRAYENFELIYKKFYKERPEVPVLNATTLLVPGYVDEQEVEAIAQFIAKLDDQIPYSLLVFYPTFYMSSLPITPLKQAIRCYLVAKRHLRRVNVGNLHLLGLHTMKQFEEKCKLEA